MTLFQKNYCCITVVFLLSCFTSFSQTGDSIPSKHAVNKQFFFTPIIAYQPETSWAFGFGAIYYFKPANHYVLNSPGYNADSLIISETFPSKLKVIGVYTLENQFQFEMGGDVYTKNNLWFISANFAFYRYPASFFGIGNNTLAQNEERYTNTHPYIRINAQKNIFKNLYLGGRVFFEHTKITNIDSAGILFTQHVNGIDGGFNTGLGPWIKYDTRDNINYPRTGMHLDASSVLHGVIFGSDYVYLDNTIEVSYFLPGFGKQILAFNVYGKFLPGSPPFNRMAELGGSDHMRGNYEGRFRDKQYLTFQTEYRIPVGRFFAVHTFAGIGEVANQFSDFSIDGSHYSFGAGGRFFLIPDDKLSLRFDYAFGSKSIYDAAKGKNVFDKGLYVTIGEAF